MRKWIFVSGVIAAFCSLAISIISWVLITKNMDLQTTLPVLLVCVSSIAISLLIFGVSITRKIRQEASEFENNIDDIFKFKLDTATKNLANNAFSELKQNVLDQVSEYKTTANRLTCAGDSVAIGSAEISFFLDQLNHTINNNVDQANQISVATEEITQTTGSIAETANQVSEVVARARSHSDEGANVVEKINDQIHEFRDNVITSTEDARYLSELSTKIQNITEVINDVAEQTNLLALNAAIEAARAGEHGRGFAVVADEVRTLANKTTSATEEIGGMLQEVQQQTEKSVQTMSALEEGVGNVVSISEDAKQTFVEIKESTKETATKIYEIKDVLKEHVIATGDLSPELVPI